MKISTPDEEFIALRLERLVMSGFGTRGSLLARLNGFSAVGSVGWKLNFLTGGHFRARVVKINNLFDREQKSRLGAEGNESQKRFVEDLAGGVWRARTTSGKSYDCVINDVIKEMFANGKQGIVLSFCILAAWPEG